MKIQRKSRVLGILLALAVGVVSLGGFPAGVVYGSEQAHVSDVVELRLNGQTVQVMSPYPNVCFEGSFTTVEGENQYQVLRNGRVLESRIVDTYPGTLVYVRYFPYHDKQVTDNINDSEQFPMEATWVGELTGLNLVRGGGEQLQRWDPEDKNGRLDYIGGGIWQKVFAFTGPLPSEQEIEYKIAFEGGWETPAIGGPNSANLKMTIPAGTRAVFVCADSVENKCYVSMEQGGAVTVSLAGTFNGNQNTEDGWVLEPVRPGLYGKGFYLEGGHHSYRCLLNGQDSGVGRTWNLSQGRFVYFLYDFENQQLYDSVNHSAQLDALFNFQRPLTAAELDQRAYGGSDLGASYSPEGTTFKVWAPTALAVSVNLYETGGAGEDTLIQSCPMDFSAGNGVWAAAVPGDLNGVFYTYSVTVGSETQETVDIYAKAVGLNGDRGMVINLEDTNPEGWERDSYVQRQNSTDAIIWETHVRDFSVSSDSGISSANRGKYLAFTERGTTVNGDGNTPTGIDYLEDLGINYIHLLPAQDFVNDETGAAYNWGYCTKNYFVPEGCYSVNPADGFSRIREFKQMVQSLHQADIGVVMDVVYNHTGMSEDSWFNRTVPDYYYRLDENGDFLDRTLCGNETASDHVMFRKYMIDSLLYWAREYHVDGFRFDLMAIHDTETMNAVRRELDRAGLSHVILYGEPWYATRNEEELAPGYLAANKDNAAFLDDRIAMFNSYTRTGMIGGLDGSGTGFVQGGVPAVASLAAEGTTESLMSAITASSDKNRGTAASPAWARNPAQSVSYSSCHDDCTLYDWLFNSIYGAPQNKAAYGRRDEMLVDMNRLAALLNLTNQGLVFFQAGEEFARTKEGDNDSYQSPDRINAIHWTRLEQYRDLRDYYKGLIAIRRQIPAFREPGLAALNSIRFLQKEQEHLIAYTIQNGQNGADRGTVAVLANAAFMPQTVELPADQGTGCWAVLADGDKAGVDVLEVISGNTVTVPAQTGMILVSVREEAQSREDEGLPSETENGGGEFQAQSQAEESLPLKTEKAGGEFQTHSISGGEFRMRSTVRTGRQAVEEGNRYYDEEGNLLSGWILYDSGSKTAEPYDGVIDSDNIYYLDADGYPVTGWHKLWAPEYLTEDGLDTASALGDDAGMNWYYFQDNGKLYRNGKKEIDNEQYCFDAEGRRMEGWIYQLTGGEEAYVVVDKDTPEDVRNDYNQDYSRYLYANPYDGKLSRNKWEYLLYPGQEEELDLDDDGRSFYFKNNGHVETGEDAIVKTAIVVDEIGTYKLRDYSQELRLLRIDGDLYLLDNVAGSVGDVVYLTGGSQTIPDGFYCFKGDNNKMLTGAVTLQEDIYTYYYYFAKENSSKYHKGQGVTGVYNGRLYYQGMAVGAPEGDQYEVVYLPTIEEERDKATGMFVVDEKGYVKTGSYLRCPYGMDVKVEKIEGLSGDYGYQIYEVIRDEDNKKVYRPLAASEASRIYLDDIERQGE